MSLARCYFCEGLINTDYHPESLYVFGYEDKCVCHHCMELHDLLLVDEVDDIDPTLNGGVKVFYQW